MFTTILRRSVCIVLLASVTFHLRWPTIADAPPASPRIRYNFNPGWKFLRSERPDQDIPGFEASDFDDSSWQTVSTPHTFNDADSFRVLISHGRGDRGTYKGLAFYRKHFQLPASAEGGKVFLEFEGLRQAGQFFLNGKEVGLSENGVTPYGVDFSKDVNFRDRENVLAVRVDNRTNYVEKATGTTFQWNTNDFNPDHGGLNRRVWLHVTGKIYQTLPIYDGLQTTGVYVYPANISLADRVTDVTVESQVQNASEDRATVALSAVVVDHNGQVVAKFNSQPLDMVAGEKSTIEATGRVNKVRFWSPDDPYLYDVYTLLTVDGKVVDVNKIRTGFRKTDFKGGAGTGGVYINDKFVYLKGFAQRSSDEWAGLGQAYPDWMHDLHARLLCDCHGNYIRWMHVAPQRVDVEACDRFGIVQVCPAGDKERDAQGRQWEQRLEVMRDSMIYFRNNPSILFWEAGNNGVSAQHLQQMVDLRQQWDPHGGRVMGCRTLQGRSRRITTPPKCRILRRDDWSGSTNRPPGETHRHVSRLQRRAPRPRPADRNRRFSRRSGPAILGRLFAHPTSVSSKVPRTLQLELGNLRAGRRESLLGVLDQSDHAIPIRRTPNGRATPRYIFPIPTPTDGSNRAKSAASAARSMPCGCRRRSTSSIA